MIKSDGEIQKHKNNISQKLNSFCWNPIKCKSKKKIDTEHAHTHTQQIQNAHTNGRKCLNVGFSSPINLFVFFLLFKGFVRSFHSNVQNRSFIFYFANQLHFDYVSVCRITLECLALKLCSSFELGTVYKN